MSDLKIVVTMTHHPLEAASNPWNYAFNLYRNVSEAIESTQASIAGP